MNIEKLGFMVSNVAMLVAYKIVGFDTPGLVIISSSHINARIQTR